MLKQALYMFDENAIGNIDLSNKDQLRNDLLKQLELV